ncbi:MAG: NUDIX domain-containing protein [Bacteroidales bacterium]|nr:NUDIX domain-containing protein [Bacteroidales bacterium]
MNNNLNPHISVDCVIFGFDSERLKVLLIERRIEYNNNHITISSDLKLPGDLVRDDEDLDISAHRVLKELTGLDNIYLEQFYSFGDPHRISNPKDLNWLITTSNLPIKRVVTVAYYSLVKIDQSNLNPSSDEYNYVWYNINDIPKLAFDHNIILNKALEALRNKLKNEPVGFELLPKKFTKNQLQKVYEEILGISLDNRNFRKKIAYLPYIIPLNEKQKGVAHKPALLYKFDRKMYLTDKKKKLGFLI